MRRYIRDQVIALLQTIVEAAKLGMIEESQEGLLTVKEILKQNLSDEGFKKYRNKFSIKNISELIYMLKKESGVLIEIAFFPYKASMWDSLESIWAAVKDDPSCFVSVVPIPYYELNNGKKIFRYDGSFFPDYVPIVDWQDYDLENVCPDIAYTHNVYDSNNYVTQVHPMFFTQALKKYVDLLIYVPYFVNSSSIGGNMARIVAMSKADIVIIPSQSHATVYKNEGAKQILLPLGSPKIDRTIAMEQYNPHLPEQWKNLEGKKIFFLNSSIGSLLRYTENYFDKLNSLFSIFEKRSDIALLWRPHPLTDATINSMRPHVRGKYLDLQKNIKAGDWGILDDTSDMYLGMAVSDAYLGDGSSSLLYLYALSGKPMFIVNFNMPIEPEPKIREELLHTGILSWDPSAKRPEWGFCADLNALCKIDTNTMIAEYVDSVPKEKNTSRLYSFPITAGNKLIFAPVLARSWAVYDTVTGHWDKFPLPPLAIPHDLARGVFLYGIPVGNFILFLPDASHCIARYDLTTEEFEYFYDWYDKLANLFTDSERSIFQNACYFAGQIYAVSSQCNKIFEISPITMTILPHSVGNFKYHYLDIACFQNQLWLTRYRYTYRYTYEINWEESVIAWNPKSHKVREYVDLPVEHGHSAFMRGKLNRIICNGNKLYIFPWQGSNIIYFDSVSNSFKKFEIDFDFDFFDHDTPYSYSPSLWISNFMANNTAFFDVYPEFDNTILAYPTYDCSLMKIDLNAKISSRKKWCIKGIDELRLNTEPHITDPLREDAFLNMSNFIDKVVDGTLPPIDMARADYYKGINVNSDGSCGQKIHENIMQIYKSRKR